MDEEKERLLAALWKVKDERNQIAQTLIRSHRLLDSVGYILKCNHTPGSVRSIISSSHNEMQLIESELESIGIVPFGSYGEKMNNHHSWFGIKAKTEFTVVEPAWLIEVLGENVLLREGSGY